MKKRKNTKYKIQNTKYKIQKKKKKNYTLMLSFPEPKKKKTILNKSLNK
jgi:hypothetical protein